MSFSSENYIFYLKYVSPLSTHNILCEIVTSSCVSFLGDAEIAPTYYQNKQFNSLTTIL